MLPVDVEQREDVLCQGWRVGVCGGRRSWGGALDPAKGYVGGLFGVCWVVNQTVGRDTSEVLDDLTVLTHVEGLGAWALILAQKM